MPAVFKVGGLGRSGHGAVESTDLRDAGLTSMSSEPPFVTLAVPAYQEEQYIETCLLGILAQDYPADRMEILVADGGSTDRTREIVGRIAGRDRRVRLLDNSQYRIQARGLNLCIRESRGAFIIVIVVHAEYAENYVSALVREFQRTGADVAGGAQRMKARTFFQQSLCAAFDSPLAMGGASYRSEAKDGWVDTVFPGAFRRAILEKVGGYDGQAVTNEDAELMQRVLAAGGRIYLSRDVVVHYYPRKSLALLAKQYFRYGQGRARTLLIHGRFAVWRPAIPFMALMVGLLLAAIPPLRFLVIPVAASYIAAISVEAMRCGSKLGPSAVPIVGAIFPTLHLAHAIGFAAGLVKYTAFPRPPVVETLQPSSPR
jgi:cellulose synthase/poly-beta-1,6-N-acetylglucosamine synthase-like glycosyltransferase